MDMMKPRRHCWLGSIGALALLSFATERQALAYAEPGTGAMLWQFLAAAAVGAMFYARKVTSWLRKKKDPGK